MVASIPCLFFCLSRESLKIFVAIIAKMPTLKNWVQKPVSYTRITCKTQQ